MRIKALFFDIDGTLVSFQTHRIPASTIEALEKAKKKVECGELDCSTMELGDCGYELMGEVADEH